MIPEYRTWNGQGFDYCTLRARKGFSPQESGIWYDLIQTHPKGVIFGTLSIKGEEEIEQYTGLKDVEGNKIFEGDILKLSYDDPKTYLYTDEYDCNPKIIPPRTVTRTVKVINEKGAFRVIALHIKSYFTRLLCDVDQGRENIEIIGNIHENPELLEVEK